MSAVHGLRYPAISADRGLRVMQQWLLQSPAGMEGKTCPLLTYEMSSDATEDMSSAATEEISSVATEYISWEACLLLQERICFLLQQKTCLSFYLRMRLQQHCCMTSSSEASTSNDFNHSTNLSKATVSCFDDPAAFFEDSETE